TRDALAMRMSLEDWDAVINTNLRGAFSFIHALVRAMTKQRSGRVINISSVIGLMGNAGQTNYAASKAGLIGLTKSLARELASRNITVNAVAPGFVITDMTVGLSHQVKDTIHSKIPLGRTGTPEEIAAACAPSSKACTADKHPRRRNGFAGSRCVLLTHAIDRSSHCTTSSNRHIRPEWGISVRISALLIAILSDLTQDCLPKIDLRNRCEDASHSKALRAQAHIERLFHFAP